MPYIDADMRPGIDRELKDFLTAVGHLSPGELAYVLYQIAIWQMTKGGTEDTCPASFADSAIFEGVVGHVMRELYRKQTVPYEMRKEADNGPVIPIKAGA